MEDRIKEIGVGDIIQTNILFNFIKGKSTDVREALSVMSQGEIASFHMDLVSLAQIVMQEYRHKRGITGRI